MLTAISGYWMISKSKTLDSNYFKWFKNSLSIDCPYVFFYYDDSIYNMVKEIRDKLVSPTHYIRMNIDQFYTYKFYDNIQTDWVHCPSKELNIIWIQKLFLMQIVKNLNPFNSDYFIWIDAGICEYRDKTPPATIFPNRDKLLSLPTDKFVFTSSEFDFFIPNRPNDDYYHYIAGTSFLLHKNFIDFFVELFKTYLNEYLSKTDWRYTDQVIYTIIYKEHPELFHKIGHGFGKIVELLY